MKKITSLILALLLMLSLVGCSVQIDTGLADDANKGVINESVDNTDKPLIFPYSGKPYLTLNDNVPQFYDSEKTAASFEKYSELDSLDRCGVATAVIGQDIMPTEERGAIGQVKPSGWQTVKYDCVDGKYLYNRCHLIGFQLTGENANEKNLITGTRYMNVDGMLPFENMVADYVKETGNHVAYRVTPHFEGQNLVASGVQMEAYSIEDEGEGISFNVYCYNVQPGVQINYADGTSTLVNEEVSKPVESAKTYILNTNTKKFHLPSCASVADISEENKGQQTVERYVLIENGFSPCGNCKP